MVNCRYCQIIKKNDSNYKVRKANWDLGSDFPRCAWHWQFVCDRCGRGISFNGVSWCDKSKEFFCVFCAPHHRKKTSSFWAWDNYYDLWCQKCSSHHGTLDWLEYKGRHPWQSDESARRVMSGLSRKKRFKPPYFVRWAPRKLQRPSLKKIQKDWDDAAEIWDAGYNKYGDAYRQKIFNPALFSLLGNVKSKRILDAGCGAGYFSRLLAERGAKVIGVDLSKKFIEIAKRYEKEKKLGIKYEVADIANLSQFRDGSFDMVVSVYVLSDTRDCKKAVGEIARVLKPKGRFIFLTSHPCFDWQAGGWERVPTDSQRDEDNLYFKIDDYFKHGTLENQWGNLPVLLSFHWTLTDYFRFLTEKGFLIRNLVEPRPLRKALRERPRDWEREDRIPPVIIFDAVKSR